MKRTLSKSKFYLLVLSIVLAVGLIPLAYFAIALPQISIEDGSHHSAVADKTNAEDELAGDNADQALNDGSAASCAADSDTAGQEGTEAQEGSTDADSKAADTSKESTDSSKEATDTTDKTGDTSKQEETQEKDSEAKNNNELNSNTEFTNSSSNLTTSAAPLGGAVGTSVKIIKSAGKGIVSAVKEICKEYSVTGITIGESGKQTNYFIDEWTFAHYNEATQTKTPNWEPEVNTWLNIQGDVTLIIKDGMKVYFNEARAKDGADEPGIRVSGDNSLTITGGVEEGSQDEPLGDAILKCYGGSQSAGIGGKGREVGCNITIEACNITAYGSYDEGGAGSCGAAGIGGGAFNTGYNITINGGAVNAYGSGSGYGGAAIGSGFGAGCNSSKEGYYPYSDTEYKPADCGGYNINITGGTVYAFGKDHGAAIGGGYDCDGHDIHISGGHVVAYAGDSASAIGGGDNHLSDCPHGYNILIDGNSSVYAYGDNGGAGVGSGNGHKAWGILIGGNAQVYAKAAKNASGIGGGDSGDGNYIQICGYANVKVDACDDETATCTGIGGGSSNNGWCKHLKIFDHANVTAYGRCGAGIGGGAASGKTEDLEIFDEAQVWAYNLGSEGAAIGAGKGGEMNSSLNIVQPSNDTRTFNPYIYAEASGSKSPGIGNSTYEKDKDDKKHYLSIDGNLAVYNVSTGSAVTRKDQSGNYGWGDVKDVQSIEVKSSYAEDPIINVSRQTETWPTVGHESSVEYKISAQYMNIVNDGYQVCWYSDPEGTTATSAPSYLTTDSRGNGAFPVLQLNTCPNQFTDDYNITPAGTYYFRIESVHSGKTVKSDVQAYTIQKAKTTIKTHSAKKVKDGQTLKCEEFTEIPIVVAEKTTGSTGSEPFTIYDTVVESCSGYAQAGPEVTPAGEPVDNTISSYTIKKKYQHPVEELSNYDVTVETGTLEIVESTLTIVGKDYYGEYDGNEHEFESQMVLKGAVEIWPTEMKYQTSTDKTSWSDWSTATPSIKDAGTLYIKAKGKHDPYETQPESENTIYTMTVVPASVGIVSASAQKEYDSTPLVKNDPSTDITYTGKGFVYGDGVDVTFDDSSTQTYVGSTPNKFTYEVKEGTSTNLKNYNITTTFGTLSVTKNTKPITIYTGSKSKTYDGSELTFNRYAWTPDIIGVNDSLEITVDGTITDAGSVSNSIGSYVVKNGDKDVTDYYTFTQAKCGTLTVEPRQVVLTSGSAAKVYDGAPLTCETVDIGGQGLVHGDELTYSNFASVTRADEGVVNNTFDYYFNDEVSAATKANNYKFTVNYGKLKIIEKLGVIGTDVKCYYDGYSQSAPATVVGSLSYDLTYQTSTDGSSWSAWTADVPTRTDAGITFIKARAVTSTGTESCEYTLTVDKRPVTISTGSASHQYSGTALTCNESTISGMGFVDGQGATVKITGTQTDMGESDNTFTYTLNAGTSADNYEITESPGKLTVTKNMSPVNITTGSDSQAYNGLPLTNSDFTYEGTIFDGDTLVVAPNGSITDVGSTQNTVSDYQVVRADGKVITDYYTFSDFKYGTLTVNARYVQIETGSAEKVYDATPLINKTYRTNGDGFIGDEGLKEVNISGTQTNAGSSENTATYTLKDGTKAQNYSIVLKFGTLTVSKRQVTLASGSAIGFASDVSEANPVKNPSCTVAGLGFVTGEVNANYPQGNGTNPGPIPAGKDSCVTLNTIDIGWTSKGNPDNYDITATLGRLVVVKDDASEAVATGYTGVYDGQAHGGQVATTLSEASKKYSTDKQHWQTDPITRTDAGETTVYVEITGKDTHEASVTLKTDYKLTITERPVTLTAGSDTKVYDGTALTCDDVIVGGSGFAYNESKGKSEKPSTLSTEGSLTDVKIDPDTGEILSETNKVVGYDTAEEEVGYNPNNYNITPVNGSLTVTKRSAVLLSKSLGVPGSSQDTVVYDGKKHEVKEVTEVGKETEKKIPNIGFVDGEGATYDSFEQYTHAGSYRNIFEYHLNTLTTKDTNYNIKQCYGVIKITPRSVGLVSADAQKMYDETPLTCDTVYENGQGFVSGEGAIYDVTGSQTQVGQSENTFTYTLKDNTLAADYDISTDCGILQVYTANTLRIVTPQNQVFDYDGKRHGDCAYAYIGEEPETSVQLFYSLDGGKTWTTGPAKQAAIGVTNVIVHADKEGYEQASANYNITINAVPGDPYVYQEDLDKIAEQYKDLGTTVFARVAIDMDTTADPADLAKLQAAEPGKNLKYDNVRLLLTALDDNDQPVTKGGITYDDYDIGDVNNVVVRITYKANTNEIKDLNCLRVHKGELNYLPQVDTCGTIDESWSVDKQNGTVTIGAKKYSTYALAYNGIESVQGFLSGSTGDSVPLAMVVTALAAVGVGIIMLSAKLRRRRVR